MRGWRERLDREAIAARHPGHDHRYHVSLRPACPPAYVVDGMVAITFREGRRLDGALRFVTSLDPAAALRLGARLGLDEGESLAFVDAHERTHVALQLEGAGEEDEEEASRHVDAVWLSLRHPRAAGLVRAGAFGLVTRVREDFWERLVDAG
ncbi:MAG TPA: hypothetical protein VNX21_09695 [Candidatus Thermoplasmatota archaeon]|nr:hypothetical protein [Candidatus Thermoplasmatota archaeon]